MLSEFINGTQESLRLEEKIAIFAIISSLSNSVINNNMGLLQKIYRSTEEYIQVSVFPNGQFFNIFIVERFKIDNVPQCYHQVMF
jgi:hypothetical protein